MNQYHNWRMRKFLDECFSAQHGETAAEWSEAATRELRPHLTDEQWDRLIELLKALEPFIPLILALL